jgi:ABC-2 type transport system ATP-binding protein
LDTDSDTEDVVAVADPAAALTTTRLTKRYGSSRRGATVVDAIDLRVPTGAVYGFLGPNGSGKTTTIRMLLGLVFPTAGSHTLLGREFAVAGTSALTRVGALVEGPAFHPYLSGRANLQRLDAADRRADPATTDTRIAAALERVGLSAAATKRYRTYSLGMRQRLGIAAALLRPRDLLVLDEPTNGLDPQGTREVRTLIGDLAASGVTVFLSSHLLSEVEHVCSHVGVMSAGRLVWQGELAELRSQQTARLRVTTAAPALVAAELARQGLVDIARDGEDVITRFGDADPERVLELLVRAGGRIRGFTVERPTLEEQFVGLTGEGFDVSG